MTINNPAEDTPIPESAAPPPAKPPGLFSIGSPLFNMGLVAMLMGISFIAVALPARSDIATAGVDEDTPPGVLAFEDPVEVADGTSTTTTTPSLEEVVAQILDKRAAEDQAAEQSANPVPEDDSSGNTEPVERSNQTVAPPEPQQQEVVQVVYRTEQVPVPTAPRAATPTAATPPASVAPTPTTTTVAPTTTTSPAATSTVPRRIQCTEFQNQPDAQSLYDDDPQTFGYLDGDGDGRACEGLPGTPPEEEPEVAPASQVLSVDAVRQQQGVFGMHTREAPWWMGEFDYVTRLVGKAPNNLLFFSNWSTPFPAEQVRTAWGRGMTPQVAWEPVIPGADQQPTLREIADGEWDAYIDEWAAAAAAHGQPIVLRFASEMNGNWYSWSEQLNGNSEGDYVDMWRHVHGRFEDAGADNVVWLWSVNRSNNLKTEVASYWPGEEYADWVGISGYWRGFEGAPEPTFEAIFDQTLNELRAITAKPILLAEIGAGTNVDSDRVQWLNTVFAGLDANRDVIGFVYFNDTKAGGDWRIQFSQPMVDAFAAGVADDRWKSGALPTGMKVGDRLSVPAHSDPDNQGLAE